MATLQDYIYQTRRLLHDAQANFYSDEDLTDYVNQARDRVAGDSGCLRSIQTNVTLNTGQETYTSDVLSNPELVLDVLGVTIYWGNTRIKLGYLPWSEFDARMRYWTSYQQRPVFFTKLNQTTFYVGPTPDQSYNSDWDVIYKPYTMIALGDTDTIIQPFDRPIKYYAAYLAKRYEQSYGESEVFLKDYQRELQMAAATYQRRTIKNPYYLPSISGGLT